MHSNQFKQHMTWYDMTYATARNYNALCDMLTKFLETKRVDQNRNQYSRKSHQPLTTAPGVKGGDKPKEAPNGFCRTFWKTGKCKKKDEGKCMHKHEKGATIANNRDPPF